MLQVRRADERGKADLGWLRSRHTFSFGDYRDPAHTHFRSLRVMNEDWIEPGHGFGMHPHRDMEIVTHVLEGELEHRDNLGNGSVIGPGRLQRMTAGRGIMHSEFNPSKTNSTHLYQIWLFPNQKSLDPSYDERTFGVDQFHNAFGVVASPDGRDDSLLINQDAVISLASIDAGESFSHELTASRHAWLQVTSGRVSLNDHTIEESDGVALSDEGSLSLVAHDKSQVMLFDMA